LPNIFDTIRYGKMIRPHIYGEYDKEGLHYSVKLLGLLWQRGLMRGFAAVRLLNGIEVSNPARDVVIYHL
jgi:hypothetical protein